MKKAAVKQQMVLDNIQAYLQTHKYPPTVRDLAEVVGISISTVHVYLHRLKSNGLIDWQPTFPRTLRILKQAEADKHVH